MGKVKLEKVGDSTKPAFVNIFNLYHHDRAAFLPDLYSAVDEEGYYDKANTLNVLRVSQERAQSYLIRCEEKIAGIIVFALSPLVKQGCDYSIVDLFILNNYRCKGIASSACRLLFREFPGRYYIEVIESDHEARGYWDRLIAKEGRLIEQTKAEEPLVSYEFEV
jgi:predicted acetyltransferase